MNEAGVDPVLSDHEVRELRLLIEQRTGIVFDESRARFLTSACVSTCSASALPPAWNCCAW